MKRSTASRFEAPRTRASSSGVTSIPCSASAETNAAATRPSSLTVVPARSNTTSSTPVIRPAPGPRTPPTRPTGKSLPRFRHRLLDGLREGGNGPAEDLDRVGVVMVDMHAERRKLAPEGHAELECQLPADRSRIELLRDLLALRWPEALLDEGAHSLEESVEIAPV